MEWRRGPGRGGIFFTPLSLTLSPLVPRGERGELLRGASSDGGVGHFLRLSQFRAVGGRRHNGIAVRFGLPGNNASDKTVERRRVQRFTLEQFVGALSPLVPPHAPRLFCFREASLEEAAYSI